MPKYRIVLTEEIVYEAIISARSAAHAKNKAYDNMDEIRGAGNSYVISQEVEIEKVDNSEDADF